MVTSLLWGCCDSNNICITSYRNRFIIFFWWFKKVVERSSVIFTCSPPVSFYLLLKFFTLLHLQLFLQFPGIKKNSLWGRHNPQNLAGKSSHWFSKDTYWLCLQNSLFNHNETAALHYEPVSKLDKPTAFRHVETITARLMFSALQKCDRVLFIARKWASHTFYALHLSFHVKVTHSCKLDNGDLVFFCFFLAL